MSDLMSSLSNNKPNKEIKADGRLSRKQKAERDANPRIFDEVKVKPHTIFYKDATESFKDVILGKKKRKR
jgi:hypothetical protein